jgi:hypothetical protein
MKTLFITIILLLSMPITTTSQAVDIKKWKGTYPRMNDSYPLTFLAFKGWLPPVPHFFVRVWPTHYYFEVGALPVSDGSGYAATTRQGFLRIASKLIDQKQMGRSMDAVTGIKENTLGQKFIEQKIFDARQDELPDIYDVASGFVVLHRRLDELSALQGPEEITALFRKEANELMSSFLMINLMETDHGSKVEAFSRIRQSLGQLLGLCDYTGQKLSYYKYYDDSPSPSLSFLGR